MSFILKYQMFFSVLALAEQELLGSDQFTNTTAKSYLFGNESNQIQELSKVILSDMLGVLSEKDIIVHVDSRTSYLINDIITKNNIKHVNSGKGIDIRPSVTTILNYEDAQELGLPGECPLRRSATFHLVCLQNASVFDEKYKYFLKRTDAIIFVCHEHYDSCKENLSGGTLTPDFLKDSDFFDSLLIILLVEFSGNNLRFYEGCNFCGIKAKTFSLIYELHLDPELKLNSVQLNSEIEYILKEKHLDFNLHTFDIVFNHRGINFICENPTNISSLNEAMVVICENSESLEGNMIEEISKKLNFKYRLLNFEHKRGTSRESLINLVSEKRADIAIGGITITESRLQRVDFSYSVTEDPCKVLYSVRHSFFEEGLMMVYVFSAETWAVIVLTLVGQAIAVFLFNKYSKSQKIVPFHKILWIVGFSLIDQTQVYNVKSVGGRVLIISWLLCCINIGTLYKAQLSSFITKPSTDKLQTFDELVKDGYSLNLIKAQFLLPMFNTSSDKSLQELSHRVKLSKLICVALHEFIGKKEMVVEEIDSIIDALVKHNNDGVLTKNDIRSIRVTHDNIFPTGHGWAFKKGTPVLDPINEYILRFYESGLQKKWSEKLTNTPPHFGIRFDGLSSKSSDDDDYSSKRNKMFGPFVVWIIGVVVSCFSFIGEIALRRMKINLQRKTNLVVSYKIH